MNLPCLRYLTGWVSVSILLLITLSFSASLIAEEQDYSPKHTERLLEKTLDVMEEHYIEPDIVPRLRELLSERLSLGYYNKIKSYTEFAEVIGRDLRVLADDDHLSMFVKNDDGPVTHVMSHRTGKLTFNQGVEEVRYLGGNIGYLKFHRFSPEKEAVEILDAAMSFLKSSDGMVIDMRSTMGGSPELARHMLSYFLPPETPLWQVYGPDKQAVSTTLAKTVMSHSNFAGQYPVWILTSHQTSSAAELFAGIMQANGKATIIGDVTAGAGFLVGVRSVNDKLVLRISLLKPVISASGKTWEKVGIQPDIRIPTVDAFDHAYALGQSTRAE